MSLKDSLPEELKVEKSLDKFEDVSALAKSYVELSKMIGNSVRIPTEATEEEIAKLSEKVAHLGLGKLPKDEDEVLHTLLKVPTKPEELKINLPEDLQGVVEDEVANKLLERALELKMTNKQAEKFITASLKEIKADREGRKAKLTEAEAKIKEMFGADFEARTRGMELAAKMVAEKVEGFEEFANSDAAKHPAVAFMLSELAKTIREGNAILGKPAVKYTETPAEASAKLEAMRADPAYFLEMHPNHKLLMAEKERLIKLLS